MGRHPRRDRLRPRGERLARPLRRERLDLPALLPEPDLLPEDVGESALNVGLPLAEALDLAGDLRDQGLARGHGLAGGIGTGIGTGTGTATG